MASVGNLVKPHASAAWQHAFDHLTPDAALAFLSLGTGFAVTGVSLAQDSALIDVGFDLNLNSTITLGVSYAGQFAKDLQPLQLGLLAGNSGRAISPLWVSC
jgi:uncharacterized protein with beta-barrel porin domain